MNEINLKQPDTSIFDEVDFRKKGFNKINRTTEQDKVLMSLYDTYTYNVPHKDEVINLKYIGKNEEYHLFDGNFKDYVRVDNKPVENRYLSEAQICE